MKGALGRYGWVLAAGLAMGLAGSGLAYLGNPPNTGLCISCFLENAAGALGLHANARMQYLRPELLGFLLGSFGAALVGREFRPRFKSPALVLLGFGFLMAVGSAVFVGCPIKAMLRLAAGDLTALLGFAGLIAGVAFGLAYVGRFGAALESGPPRAAPALPALGLVAAAGLLAVLVLEDVLPSSTTGGASLKAPAGWSLGAGLVLGALSQRSRFCVTGSLRDALLTRSAGPALGLFAALAAAAALDAATGQFRLGYADQPGAHLEWAWSFAGMALVGVVAVLAGGCPFRQIVKAGEGDLDAAAIGAGMLLGGALVQNWGLGGTPSGVPAAGKVAVLLGFGALFALGLARGEAKG